LKVVPGAMFFIGAGNREQGIINPHHHPCFNIDENALMKGTEALVWSSLGLLECHEDTDFLVKKENF